MLLLIYNVEEMKMQFIDERLLFLMMNRLYLEIKMDLTKDLLMIFELLHLQPPTSKMYSLLLLLHHFGARVTSIAAPLQPQLQINL